MSQECGGVWAVRYPKEYLQKKYQLDWDSHPNPSGNRILASACARMISKIFPSLDGAFPELGTDCEIDTTVEDICSKFDVERIRRKEWKEVPTQLSPDSPSCYRLSTGIWKSGWVSKQAELPLRMSKTSPGKLRVKGKILGHPSLLPQKLEIGVGTATKSVLLEKVGPFSVDLDLGLAEMGLESEYGGLLVKFRASNYCSTLGDHRMLSWVLTQVEFTPL
jgi:hypothetical protein